MSQVSLDDLLQRMQSIAEAVNQFKSEVVQQQAFTLLMQAAGVEHGKTVSEEPTLDAKQITSSMEDAVRPVNRKPAPKREKLNANKPSLISDLNLRPQNTVSLRDFVAEKTPKTNEEHFAVFVYYLQHKLNISGINQNHIYTGFKELNIKVPIDINDGLYKCAHRKGWIDASDTSNITITTRGENFVEHDLPKQEPKK